jgi:hypothetical protein
MGGMAMPEVGFDEAAFRHEFTAVLAQGTARMSNANTPDSFLSAYDGMDRELAGVVESFGPPVHVLDDVRYLMQQAVEATVAESDIDLRPVCMAKVRKTCLQILNGAATGNLLQISQPYDDAVSLLVEKGNFTADEARTVLSELSDLGGKSLNEMLGKAGRSRKLGLVIFLSFMESHGNPGARKAAAEAKAELLSAISAPPANMLRLPEHPRPLTRIRQ